MLKATLENLFSEIYENLVELGYIDSGEAEFETARYVDSMVVKLNNQMGEFLNSGDYRIYGYANNLEYAFPKKMPSISLKDAIDLVKHDVESELSEKCREAFTEWFFETFGTKGLQWSYRDYIWGFFEEPNVEEE